LCHTNGALLHIDAFSKYGEGADMTLPPLLDRISDYVAWHAAETPDAAALVLSGNVMTYRLLKASVDALAKALLAAGVGKGDRVATLQTPHPDYVTAWLATASIGAIWVGLNPRYQTAELTYVIEDAEPKVLLTRRDIGGRSYLTEIAALASATTTLEHVVAFENQPGSAGITTMPAFLAAGNAISDDALKMARDGCGGRDPCVIVYTSGSTGKPKGALLHHEGIAAFGLAQNEVWPVNPHSNINFLPINHIGCVCDITAPCLVAGGTMHFMEQFDPAAATCMIETEKLTLWASVPSVFAMQMATPEYKSTDLSSLQLILWEGAAMPDEMISDLLKIGPPMATNYGMTESVSGITVLPPTRDHDLLANSVGGAFPGVEIRLIDGDGNDVSDGEPGEVTFKSRYAFLGYWRRPEATAEAFTADGYFKSGDLAVRRPDGRYRVVGRLKEMYKSGGYNVYPREIEMVLEEHPAVVLAAVVSVNDPLWQEIGVAYVTLADNIETGSLVGWCRERLANYKIPKRIVVVPNMPLLPIGKIDKVALKNRTLESA
jgi:acyl-CoA synthetase (AMP-forming)/AMP-acid ligase II